MVNSPSGRVLLGVASDAARLCCASAVVLTLSVSTAAAGVSPVLECVINNGSTFTAVFGYNNHTSRTITIPIGNGPPVNKFVPDVVPPNDGDCGQPTSFLPGRRVAVFTVTSSVTIVWKLDGSTATAGFASAPCATPTATATATATSAAIDTVTATATATATDTPTASDTATATDTPTASDTATATDTPTASDTATATVTATAANSATATNTSTASATTTPTPSAAASATQTPTPTSAGTPTVAVTCPPTPLSGCATPVGFKRRLRINIKREIVSWRWRTSGSIPLSDFGDPLSTASYSLCLYTGTAQALTMQLRAPAEGTCISGKPCWKLRLGKSFHYRDRDGTSDGVTRLVLRTVPEHLADLALRARGSNVPFPPLPLAEPVLAQLVRSDAPECWEARYSPPAIKNTDFSYKDRSD